MDKESVFSVLKKCLVKAVQALIPILEVLIMDFLEII